MKLSEAIRDGANKRPNQCRTQFYRKSRNATCALGAAADAIGWDVERLDFSKMPRQVVDHFTDYRQVFVDLPIVDHAHRCSLTTAIVDLNDGYAWTREAIADWIESIGY